MPVTTHIFPTKKQYQTLVAIHTYTQRYGTAPTLAELAHTLGLAQPSSAQFRVRALIQNGWVTTGNAIASSRAAQGQAIHTPARTLRLTDRGQTILTRLERLHSSHLLYGDRALVLDGPQFVLAQKLNLPTDSLPVHPHHNRYIVYFSTPAERNSWAEFLLQHLPTPT